MIALPVLALSLTTCAAAIESLIGAIWQGALLAAGAGLALRLLPKTPAAARFAVWFAVFVMIATLPLVGHWTHSVAVPAVGLQSAWITVSSRWCVLIVALWAGISVLRTALLCTGALRVRSIWRRATPILGVSPAETDGRPIAICSSRDVDRPGVIGFFTPKILIPEWLVGKLSAEDMTQIVLHETGHLRRMDDWLNLIQKILLVLFPLNPVLAWVERKLCFERELACDDRVLKTTRAPKAYALCLAGLAEHRVARRGMALLMGALGRESELGRRVHRILSPGEQMRPAHARLVMVGAVVTLLAGAVGLEQCPRLIGFTSASFSPSRNRASIGPATYHDVVYRPDSSLRSAELMTRPAEKVTDQSQHRFRVDGVKARPATKHPSIPANKGAEEGEWVYMTSWTEAHTSDGASVVMTSVEERSVSSQIHRVSAQVPERVPRRSQHVPEVSRIPAVETHVREFSPYAAVPVAGGWLVFQM